MIRDRTRTKIEVTCDDSSTAAETSISLGLIVTELVINGLKHAFPDNRKGKITVDYRSSGRIGTHRLQQGSPRNTELPDPLRL